MAKYYLGLLLLTISSVGYGQDAPIFSNEFLSIGLGARAQGMANSLVASTDDVYSLYWNPAGLSEISSKVQVAYKHAEYFAGIANYDFGGIAIKMKDSSALAFGVIRFGVDDIANTIHLMEPDGTINFDKITYFSVADYAFFTSYGKQVGKYQLGGSAKIVHRRVGSFAQSWGFGLDFGAKRRFGESLTLGLMARDVTSTFNAWSISLEDEEIAVFEETGNDIPDNSIEITLPKLLIGASYVQPISSKFNLRSELGFDVFFDGERNSLISSSTVTLEPHLGIELDYNSIFYLRGGVGNFQEESQLEQSVVKKKTTFTPNIGAGVRLKYFSINYAYTDIGDNSGAPYSHLISLRFDITKELLQKNLAPKSEGENIEIEVEEE